MTPLFDQFNRPIAALKRPETREIAAVAIRDRWSGYPSSGLTPEKLGAIFKQADWGDLRSQAELFDEMEEKDAHLGSVLQTRRLAVLGLDWQVEAASEDARDKKIADFCREQLTALDLGGLWNHLLSAIGHGYAAAEPLWRTGAQWTVGGFNLIHPKNITFLNSLIPLVVTADNWQGMAAPPWKLVYHRASAKCGHDTRNGVLRVCGYMYLFKNYALKDWAVFNEIFGMPLRLGKYEPSATKADREALRYAIASLGSDAAGIISKSTEIEFVEAAARLSGTTNPYEVMAYFCNREMSKAVLGQTLTTDTQGSTGTYAAGAVQADVRRDLLEADARSLGETIRQQLLRPLVGFNFGWDAPVPELTLLIQDSPDLQADSQVIKNLVDAGAGAQIPAAFINEHFGIPEPKAGEVTLEKAPPPVAPSPQPSPPGGEGDKGTQGDEKGQRQPPQGFRYILPLRQDGLELIPQDAGVIRVHQDLEALTQSALAASAAAALDALKPVWDLIEAGADLATIRERLLAVYPELHPADLAEHLYQAGMLAWMKGRAGGGTP